GLGVPRGTGTHGRRGTPSASLPSADVPSPHGGLPPGVVATLRPRWDPHRMLREVPPSVLSGLCIGGRPVRAVHWWVFGPHCEVLSSPRASHTRASPPRRSGRVARRTG